MRLFDKYFGFRKMHFVKNVFAFMIFLSHNENPEFFEFWFYLSFSSKKNLSSFIIFFPFSFSHNHFFCRTSLSSLFSQPFFSSHSLFYHLLFILLQTFKHTIIKQFSNPSMFLELHCFLDVWKTEKPILVLIQIL